MLSSGIKAIDSSQALYDVPNVLYTELSLSNARCSQIDSSEAPAGQEDEVLTHGSAVMKEGFPYKTPAPLGTLNAGKD